MFVVIIPANASSYCLVRATDQWTNIADHDNAWATTSHSKQVMLWYTLCLNKVSMSNNEDIELPNYTELWEY